MRTATIRNKILDSTNEIWCSTDFGDHRNLANRVLSDLTHTNEIQRLRHGMYWRGTETIIGTTTPTSEQLLTKLLGPNTGFGYHGLTAANMLGLTTQVPATTTWAIPQRRPRSLPDTITAKSVPARTGRVEQQLSIAETSILEICQEWDDLIPQAEQGDAITRIREVLKQPGIRTRSLIAATATELQRTTERLFDIVLFPGLT